ncbi:MAG TPA: hypothetical protein VKB49_05515 [Candidatus Sulfotelmatobacter sp.]|nr:hypothetical protein [Candidatus Sulfotelmatobacter sp.]
MSVIHWRISTIKHQIVIVLPLLIACGGAVVLSAANQYRGLQQNESAGVEVTVDRIYPPMPPLTPQQRAEMVERQESEMENSGGFIVPPGPPGRPLVDDPETKIISEADRANTIVDPAPGDIKFGRITADSSVPTAAAMQVVEPSTSNMGPYIFYLNNSEADFSADGGTTFAKIDTEALRKPPSDSPNYCCDSSIVYDPSHSMWVISRMYEDTALTHGVVQLSIFKNPPDVACTYYIDPDANPNDNNVKPDYPQLGLSDNYLYLTTSEFISGAWNRDEIRRFSLEDVDSCVSNLTAHFFRRTNGGVKRVWTPVRGAHEIMYWAQIETTTQLRVFTWPESVASPTSALVKVQSTNFVDSDCRGGNNNKDWIGAYGWHANEGFLRGAVARGGVGSATPETSRLQFFWNGGADGTASHPQAFVRSAVLQLPNLAVLDEPNINSLEVCYGYADVYPNARGDLGVTIAYGGKKNGGGAGLSAGVGIEDEYTSGYNLQNVYTTTTGTDMPNSLRYGDYLSVKSWQPCPLWWSAANYAYSGGGNQKNIIARYVEFGRARDQDCYTRWKDAVPPKLP